MVCVICVVCKLLLKGIVYKHRLKTTPCETHMFPVVRERKFAGMVFVIHHHFIVFAQSCLDIIYSY